MHELDSHAPFFAADNALVSPGLPRPPIPVANLYASLGAGDTVNTLNPHKNDLWGIEASLPNPVVVKRVSRDDAAGIMSNAGTNAVVLVLGWPDSDKWDQLLPLSIAPKEHASATFTSDTTHQVGIVALRDLAPTILTLQGVAVPPSMEGHSLVAVDGDYSATLRQMNSLTMFNQRILAPLMWTLGLVALAVIIGIGRVVAAGRDIPRSAAYLIRIPMALPLAMLIAPGLLPPSLPIYLVEIVGLTALFAGMTEPWLAFLTCTVIIEDAMTGSSLISRSVLSGYWLSGIRFYGIGNEYMGILIGMSLIIALRIKQSAHKTVLSPMFAVAFALCYALGIFALSYPEFGAKAGGAVTASVAFIGAWLFLVRGKRPDWKVFVASSVVGFLLIFAWAYIAQHTGGRATHIQAATEHVEHGDLGYIAHIAERKAKMAVKTALHPGSFVGFGVFLAAAFAWRRTRLKDVIIAKWISDPAFSGIAAVGGWTILACLLFNDSGTVAAVLIFGALTLAFVADMLTESRTTDSHLVPAA